MQSLKLILRLMLRLILTQRLKADCEAASEAYFSGCFGGLALRLVRVLLTLWVMLDADALITC